MKPVSVSNEDLKYVLLFLGCLSPSVVKVVKLVNL